MYVLDEELKTNVGKRKIGLLSFVFNSVFKNIRPSLKLKCTLLTQRFIYYLIILAQVPNYESWMCIICKVCYLYGNLELDIIKKCINL